MRRLRSRARARSRKVAGEIDGKVAAACKGADEDEGAPADEVEVAAEAGVEMEVTVESEGEVTVIASEGRGFVVGLDAGGFAGSPGEKGHEFGIITDKIFEGLEKSLEKDISVVEHRGSEKNDLTPAWVGDVREEARKGASGDVIHDVSGRIVFLEGEMGKSVKAVSPLDENAMMGLNVLENSLAVNVCVGAAVYADK
jgi:hypothetical protein